jgi:hypothetical protein
MDTDMNIDMGLDMSMIRSFDVRYRIAPISV